MMEGQPVTKNLSSGHMVTLNLRGYKFEIERKMLMKLPQISPFSKSINNSFESNGDGDKLLNDILTVHQSNHVIYVNSNPIYFHYILDYLHYGSLHFPDSLCTEVIHRELKFWGLEEGKSLAPCCYDRMLKEQDTAETTLKLTKLWKRMTFKKRIKVAHNETSKFSCGRIREKLWNLLERPNSSLLAKVWMSFTILIILLSVSTLLLETLPSLREPHFNLEQVKAESNLTLGEGVYKYYILRSLPEPWILFVDIVCTIILSIEFILRFIVSKGRCRFLMKPLNIADLLGLLPMWVHFGLMLFGTLTNYNSEWMQSVMDSFAFFKLCRTLRFGRIMMLNKQLRIVILALFHSWQELCIMVSIILVTATIFGSLIYYIELKDDVFLTVFHGIWWSIITMTTVGYGDFYPKTEAGYIIGVICSICGIVLIAMATTVIVNHFLVTHAAVEIYERSKKNVSEADIEDSDSEDEGSDNCDNEERNKVKKPENGDIRHGKNNQNNNEIIISDSEKNGRSTEVETDEIGVSDIPKDVQNNKPSSSGCSHKMNDIKELERGTSCHKNKSKYECTEHI